ncbi:hypothetical protein FBU59_003277 [Linderina macrospora]|uniref:Uncharacterized protein n=1 Tax=Linderina macrospora TaxID=4868 RepID=A0ACC1J8Z7_9FUNG|nr:hypothetical protein FBU59_003277 [Linderina macrospora]
MAASYYIEVLRNLGQVDLYIKLDNHVSPSDIRLVDSKPLQLSKTATLTLPVSVNNARATTSILPSKSSKWMRIRVPISISTNRLQHLQSTVPLSQISGPICADFVRGFASICCRNCQTQLTEGSMGGVVVRDLPSTFWSELVECWVCHPEEDKLRINPDLLHLFEPDTGKIQNKETEEVVRDVWVGNTHLLAPGSLFRELPMRNVELDKKASRVLLVSYFSLDSVYVASCFPLQYMAFYSSLAFNEGPRTNCLCQVCMCL